MHTCDVLTDRFPKQLVTANHTTTGGMLWDLSDAAPLLRDVIVYEHYIYIHVYSVYIVHHVLLCDKL